MILKIGKQLKSWGRRWGVWLSLLCLVVLISLPYFLNFNQAEQFRDGLEWSIAGLVLIGFALPKLWGKKWDTSKTLIQDIELFFGGTTVILGIAILAAEGRAKYLQPIMSVRGNASFTLESPTPLPHLYVKIAPVLLVDEELGVERQFLRAIDGDLAPTGGNKALAHFEYELFDTSPFIGKPIRFLEQANLRFALPVGTADASVITGNCVLIVNGNQRITLPIPRQPLGQFGTINRFPDKN